MVLTNALPPTKSASTGFSRKVHKDRIDFATGAGGRTSICFPMAEAARAPPESARFSNRGPFGFDEHGDARGPRHQLVQEPSRLAPSSLDKKADTCDVAARPVEACD